MARRRARSPFRLGIDLGGTKTEGIVLGPSGEVVARRRVATPRDDYDATLDAIASLVAALETEAGRECSVGIGMPGTISPASGLVKNANSTWLNGRALRPDLEARVGRPLRFANDADCFVLSEAVDGAAAGLPVVFGAILGTGVGGGIVVGGRLVEGVNSIAGEWGHNPLPDPDDDERPGPACYCGRSGCVETFLAGPGLAADHARHGGAARDAAAVVSAAERGDPLALATLERYERRLAKALASVINVLDPHAIVLGGGLSNVRGLYESAPRLWTRWVFSDRVETRLLPPRHGDSSGVRGAARLWEEGAAAR